VHCLSDVVRAAETGFRSVLLSDLGTLEVAAGMREAGLLTE